MEALEDDGVRTVVGREIVIYLAERGSADLAAARPLLESVVGTLIQTEPFQRVFRSAALEANRVFFVRERENVAPRPRRRRRDRRVRAALGLAEPREAAARTTSSPTWWRCSDREFAGTTLRSRTRCACSGIVLPLLAVLLLVGAVVGRARPPHGGAPRGRRGRRGGRADRDRRSLVLEARTLAGVYGEDEVTDEEVRDAVAGLFDAFLGDLFTWALLLALLGRGRGGRGGGARPGGRRGAARSA